MNFKQAFSHPTPLDGKTLGVAVVAGGLFLFAGYMLIKKLIGEAGGLFSGNNALTEGTAYAGKGVAGTLGAATDKVTGGLTSAIGTSTTLQDALTRLFNDGYDGYKYSTTLHRWVQVTRRSDGKLFNIDAQGRLTPA